MAIEVPNTQTGSVKSEYAAYSSVTNRQLQTVNNVVVPMFSGNINYQRTDYLVDANNNKIGVVTNPNQGPMVSDPTYNDNIFIDATTLASDLAANPALAAAFQTVADYEDGKIKADLIARKIVTA